MVNSLCALGSGFTHRTMEKLSLERRPVATGKMLTGGGRRWLGGLAWVAAIAITAGVGWFASGRLFQIGPDPDEPLVRQLPIIENWKTYQNVDDIDFLKSLDQPELVGDDT